jgi:hypothetical protein
VLQLIGFVQHCSSDGIWARCIFGQVRYARSHSACVALLGFGSNRLQSTSFPLLTRGFGHGRLKVRGARSIIRSSVFGQLVRSSASPASFPPNKSFKPTPCRGVGHVLCATLARVRRPATGRLNSGVRRQKAFCRCVAHNCNSLASVGCDLRTRSRRVVTSASASCALRCHVCCGPRLRRHWPAHGRHPCPRWGRFGDGRRKVRVARSGIRASIFGLFATASP